MKLKVLTESELKADFMRRIRVVIDNKNLRSRQQRIYEIRQDQPTFEIGDNMKALLAKEGLSWE